jgi:methylase of polypeptide subunit release factors
LPAITPIHAAILRERLDASGYEARVPYEIETASMLTFEELRLPLVRRALRRDPSPAAILALLFQYASDVPLADADRVLGGDGRKWLVEAGILAVRGDRCSARFRLQSAEGTWIFCDEPGAGSDAVMAPGPTTVDLLNAMPAPPYESVLDVGTGPGTLALIAAKRGARRVVATEIAPRAVALARWNAEFNELEVDVRQGDLLAPVGDERFSLVVAQPPYVTHPEGQDGVTFMHGGARGDEIAMRLLGSLPASLAPDGVAVVLFDSPLVPDRPLHDRVRDTVGEGALDVAVFNGPGLPPDMQAIGYAALHDPTFGERYAATALRYRDHLARLDIEKVSHALVVLRSRPAGSAWTIGVPVRALPEWDDIAPFMSGLDLIVLDDDALAGSRVRPAAPAVLVRERRPGAPTERRSIRLDRPGLASERELSEAGAVIFDLLAKDPSISSAIDRFAKAMDQSVDDVRPLVLTFVKENLARGLLVPA